MRFMMIYRPSNVKDLEAGVPPTPQQMAEMGKFTAEVAKSGALVATDGLLPSAKGAKVLQSAGKVTVLDGPFTETKELIAGYAIVEVGSKAEAIDLAKRFLKAAGDGESEIRELFPRPASAR
jgi:hypothetical protein